jgi:hypothetical protein
MHGEDNVKIFYFAYLVTYFGTPCHFRTEVTFEESSMSYISIYM